MELEEQDEEEIRELVQRLDRLVPKAGAHLTIPGDPDGHTALGNRRGYLRFGVEFLAAALRPLASSEGEPARIRPEIDYLLTQDSRAPFDLCEIDEAIGSRPPVRTRLGALGQLLAGVLVVGALVFVVIASFVVMRWLFG